MTGLAALKVPLIAAPRPQKDNPLNLYWGDIHCHSGISYAP